RQHHSLSTESSPAPPGLSALVPLSPKSAVITLNPLRGAYLPIKPRISHQNMATLFQLST
ncbi:hypothetical protein, partial [Salmonella enterica]|uniref:hypothetical protein n=1 Tax=Salmonella enterica TaxID=28901 RepID=UPI001C9214AE